MPEETILTDDFLRELMNVGEVDILIGVPTFNDAKTVPQVVQAIRGGLLKYFPRQRAVIINADGGSKDSTQDLVRAASISDAAQATHIQALRTLHSISTRYEGGPAHGRALYTILAGADLLHPAACAIIAPDSVNIQPEWIDRLLGPVVRDSFDFVSPMYRRHKYDGLLVRNLIYPMNRALYGKKIREPYPTEFAFSTRFGSYFFGQDIWSEDVGSKGTELFFTISALSGGFRVAQTFLGDKDRIDHAPADLIPAMRETVGTLFWSLDRNFPAWTADKPPEAVPTLGPQPQVSQDTLRVNRKRLYDMFVHGVAELEPVLGSILTPATLEQLKATAALPEPRFRYPDDVWTRSVYEFAASYHKAVISRDHIIQALAPLYRGKTYTFLAENRDAGAEEVEQNVENLCLEFEREKPYLLELWDGKK